MWVDYRGPLSTVYNDGEISTCGWTMEVHSEQSTMMGDLNMWVDYRGPLSTVYNDGRSQHVGRL